MTETKHKPCPACGGETVWYDLLHAQPDLDSARRATEPAPAGMFDGELLARAQMIGNVPAHLNRYGWDEHNADLVRAELDRREAARKEDAR